MSELHEAAKESKALGDSAQTWAAYSRIANRYEYLEMPDSTLYYSAEAFKWANMFQGFDYYFNTVKLDPSSVEKLKPEFAEALVDFRSRLPEELWGLADEIDKSFNALCVFDTAAIIEAHQAMLEKYAQNSSENREIVGMLLVLTGRYEEGKRYLNEVVQGRYLTDQARYYIRARYYLGVADEALGNTEAAITAYREVLEYWGDADIQIELITDTRERLARLTS
jgi:tetratricopeptide (TPR) repeat protein